MYAAADICPVVIAWYTAMEYAVDRRQRMWVRRHQGLGPGEDALVEERGPELVRPESALVAAVLQLAWLRVQRRQLATALRDAAVLCELIGEPIKQSAKLTREPVKGRVKTGTLHSPAGCGIRPRA